jgi:transaldolase
MRHTPARIDDMNRLDQLRQMTTVVADSGDIESIRQYVPTDATTNPSLLLKAAQQPEYGALVRSAIDYGRGVAQSTEQRAPATLKKLAVNFGTEILKIVPGRVSTEVDARLSFDAEATIRYAEELMQLYGDNGVSPERVLIKVAATWEGIQAATELEQRGIHCNLTLLFHFAQAAACADAGVTLISPFVGRITDWYKKAEGVDGYAAPDDPGVRSVAAIYQYFKRHGYPTQVMGASFRNTAQITELAGCDLLTISPALMQELRGSDDPLPRRLDPAGAAGNGAERVRIDQAGFRWQLNDDPMATEKLAEGIRRFAADGHELEAFVHGMCRDCD